MRRFFFRLLNLLRGTHAERELNREIQSHLAMLAEDFERRGLSPADAARAARREYGGVEQTRELHREARSLVWVEQIYKDVRHGARTLLRNPTFTLVAALTLALGIGANTAIFSVVRAVLLRPLAYRDADRLVTLLHDGTDPVSVANYIDWRDQSRSFEAMAAAEYWRPNVTGGEVPEHLFGLRLTQNMLPMLGVQPALGRMFAPGEDQTGSDHKVVLSDRLWQRRFNRDANVLGKTMLLNGDPYTVIGVMPPEFKFAPFWATRAELWAPLAFGDRIHDRGGNSLRVFARLKPRSSLEQARTEIAGITKRLDQQEPGSNRGVRVTPLKENVVGKIETPLLMVMGAVGFVLLIACANVAHMMLARTTERQKEIAVRTALGASRSRVLAQFLTESLLLAAAGALAGLPLAYVGTEALVALSPDYIPRVGLVALDAPVILFLSAVTALTTVVFGLAPALQAMRANPACALGEVGRGGTGGVARSRLRDFLIISEFALAFVLLAGAGLTIRSFAALQSVDSGFNPHNVLSMVVSVAGSKEAEPGQRALFYRQLIGKVRSIPGVEAAGAINHLPLAGDMWGASFLIEGRPEPLRGETPKAVYRVAMPGYFETMRLPIRRGRSIGPRDDERSARVVVISERASKEHWPGGDPIGRRIVLPGLDLTLTIVGVAADAKQLDWAAEPYPEIYLSGLQDKGFLGDGQASSAYITLVVRTAGNPANFAPAVKQLIWSFDPNLPISEVLTMDSAVADATAQPRFEMQLFALFAALALVLSAVGIYGVINYSISRRTREIGIRMSLGATRSEVLRMVLRQGMTLAIAGTSAGLVGALLLSKTMAGLLYAVRPNDPATLVAAAVVLGSAAMLAAWIPARKAAHVEPMTALRHE